MRLYKRGRVWWLYWSESGFKHHESTGCTDKTAAGLVLRRRERECADPTHHAANEATVTRAADRCLIEWSKTCKSPHTLEMYKQKTRHVVRLLGELRLASLSYEDAMRFVETREVEGAHPHTVHRELTTLRLILRSAARAREWAGDTKAIIPRYSPQYVPRTRWLSEDELLAVSAHLEPARAAVLAFAVATSANLGETFRARKGDVGPVTTVRGTKRATRKRTVPAMAHTWPLLAFALAHADGAWEALFRPWTNMRRDILAACRRAGVAPFSSNDLRRTCATWLVKRGVHLELAAKVLGHSSTAMLRKVYGQLDAEDVGRLINERVGHSEVHGRVTSTPQVTEIVH